MLINVNKDLRTTGRLRQVEWNIFDPIHDHLTKCLEKDKQVVYAFALE